MLVEVVIFFSLVRLRFLFVLCQFGIWCWVPEADYGVMIMLLLLGCRVVTYSGSISVYIFFLIRELCALCFIFFVIRLWLHYSVDM